MRADPDPARPAPPASRQPAAGDPPGHGRRHAASVVSGLPTKHALIVRPLDGGSYQIIAPREGSRADRAPGAPQAPGQAKRGGGQPSAPRQSRRKRLNGSPTLERVRGLGWVDPAVVIAGCDRLPCIRERGRGESAWRPWVPRALVARHPQADRLRPSHVGSQRPAPDLGERLVPHRGERSGVAQEARRQADRGREHGQPPERSAPPGRPAQPGSASAAGRV